MLSAIGYAHFHLAGGTRAVIRWCVIVVLIATVGMSAYARLGGGGTAAALASSTTAALIVLGVLLVIVVNSRISTAAKLDATLDMGRSHRLMAVPPAQAVLGYLLGPTLSIFAAAGLVAIYAGAGYIAGNYDLAAWLAAVGILIVFAMPLWSLTLLNGVGGKGSGGAGWMWGIGSAVVFGPGGLIFAAVPALMIFATPFAGGSVFAMRTVDRLTLGQLVGIAGQLSLAGLFLWAAIRRWKQPDRPAFSPAMWLGFIGLIVAFTVGVVGWFEALKPTFGPFGQGGGVESVPAPGLTLPATLTLLVLMAHGPVASVEKRAAAYRLRKRVDDPNADADRPRLPGWAAMVGVALLIAPLGLLRPTYDFDALASSEWQDRFEADGLTDNGVRQHVYDDLDLYLQLGSGGQIGDALARYAWPPTVAAVLAGLVTAWALTRTLTRARMGRFGFWIYLLLWAGPMLASFGFTLWLTGELEGELLPIAAASLPGSLFHVWAAGTGSPWWGIAAQWIVAGVLVFVSFKVPDRAARPATREPPPVLRGQSPFVESNQAAQAAAEDCLPGEPSDAS